MGLWGPIKKTKGLRLSTEGTCIGPGLCDTVVGQRSGPRYRLAPPKIRIGAGVEGDIEDVNGVLKITRIRINYHLKVPPGKEAGAREALSVYLAGCPAAHSVIGCTEILHNITIEHLS